MRVTVGRVGRAHGIRGDLAVELRTDDPDKRFAVGASVFCRHGELVVGSARSHSGKLLVSFQHIADRTAAETHHGCILEAEVDPNETPDDGSFYDRQLRGLTVLVNGQARGTIKDVLHLPAHDSLLIAYNGVDVQVPFVEELVPEVDLDARTITVVDRPGLLDPSQAEEVR